MIIGHHVIFATSGHWLPNDPRGSWSQFVGAWDLFRFGPATKTTERRSLARDAHDRTARLRAKRALREPPVMLTGLQARAVARGFGDYVERSGLKIWACAVLPDHVHLVIATPVMSVEKVVIKLKAAATQQLLDQGLHPRTRASSPDVKTPKCFARGEWKVFLDPQDLTRSIRYVENNPIKERKPRQRWSFVSSPPASWTHRR